MKGNSRKTVVRTFWADGVEFTVRGWRYDLVKMMPPEERTEADKDPFVSVETMKKYCHTDPNLEVIDTREISKDERAAAWDECGWPEQVDTFSEEERSKDDDG